jgi:hypothetical protein
MGSIIKMTEEHITLLDEELQSLDDFKEICIYENEVKDIKIYIRIADIKKNVLRQDILDRYNNSEYWDIRIEENPDIPETDN